MVGISPRNQRVAFEGKHEKLAAKISVWVVVTTGSLGGETRCGKILLEPCPGINFS